MEPCTKKSYVSRTDAEFALMRMRPKYIAAGKPVPNGAYPCDRCPSWHTTSRAKGKWLLYPADRRE